MFQPLPPPVPPSPTPYFYPIPTHLGYRALKHLVKHLPPLQNYAQWVYYEALRKELRSRRWLYEFVSSALPACLSPSHWSFGVDSRQELHLLPGGCLYGRVAGS